MSNAPNFYSDENFWEKLKSFAIDAGKDAIEKALTLYYAAQRPETPLWAKTVIYSALAYFVLPTDSIPDLIPLTGYVDDMGALAAAVATVAMCITPEVKEEAKQKVRDWFGAEGQPRDRASENAPREISID